MTTKIFSKKRRNTHGDMAMILTAPLVDSSGNTWPVGTVYLPVSFGHRKDSDEQVIDISGEKVVIRK